MNPRVEVVLRRYSGFLVIAILAGFTGLGSVAATTVDPDLGYFGGFVGCLLGYLISVAVLRRIFGK